MSGLIEKQYRFLKIGEVVQNGDEWDAGITEHIWVPSNRVGRPVFEGENSYRRLEIKHYRFLKVGELIQDGDEWIREWLQESDEDDWTLTNNTGLRIPISSQNIYRRPIPESKTHEKTNVPISTARGETSTDSSSEQPDRDRHITINKSNYCWDGSVDLTEQHCISVSIEAV